MPSKGKHDIAGHSLLEVVALFGSAAPRLKRLMQEIDEIASSITIGKEDVITKLKSFQEHAADLINEGQATSTLAAAKMLLYNMPAQGARLDRLSGHLQRLATVLNEQV
jgi:hypothetical protein